MQRPSDDLTHSNAILSIVPLCSTYYNYSIHRSNLDSLEARNDGIFGYMRDAELIRRDTSDRIALVFADSP
jgi:hypothetical protein